MENTIFIFKTNGFYFGFIRNGFLFSNNGVYLGWVEGQFVWDAKGKFRGVVTEINKNRYILVNKLLIPPVQRISKPQPNPEVPPTPPSNIVPINISPELTDGFNGM